jgi:hypothetical protein
MRIFDHLEDRVWLTDTGTEADSGETGAVATGAQTQPGAASAALEISETTGGYANKYWYLEFGLGNDGEHIFEYDASFLFPSLADAEDSQSIEIDVQQVISGKKFNPAVSFNFVENYVGLWDTTQKAWSNVGVPCPAWSPLVWHRARVIAFRSGMSYGILSVALDGVSLALPSWELPCATTVNIPDMLNCGLQLNTNSKGSPYKVCVNRLKFIAR